MTRPSFITRNVIGERPHHREVVADEEVGEAVLLLQSAQLPEDAEVFLLPRPAGG